MAAVYGHGNVQRVCAADGEVEGADGAFDAAGEQDGGASRRVRWSRPWMGGVKTRLIMPVSSSIAPKATPCAVVLAMVVMPATVSFARVMG
ncbi:hypothetical protein [Streptomyces griseus]|uniref:hypothetical protein n=1 Tax=Streptomyces griseus TaxID=1911 RepID=UPI0034480D68